MEDEMDSLFEGMVLFTPAHQQLDLRPEPESKPDPDQSTPPPQPSSSSSLEPLDENLFSDVTLITAYPEPSPSPSSSTADLTPSSSSSVRIISRQFSNTRKKKRAAGLRIGYARQSSSSSSIAIANTHRDSSIQNEDDEDDDEESNVSRDISSSEVVESKPQSQPQLQPQECIVDAHDTGIEERFEQIKKQIADKLNNAREAVAAISAARKDSIRRRRKASDALSQASAKYMDLEKAIEQACETEDFEEADRLSQSLSSADKDRELLLASLRDAEAHCDALDSEMHRVLQAQIQAEEECASLLNSFAMDAAGDADLILKNAEATFSKEMEEWLSSTEAVEVKKLELEIESRLMHEGRSVLNHSIEHSVEDDRRERDLLYEKKEILAEELDKLLALVKEKEAEIEENNSNVDKVEKRIASIISTFKDEQSSIDTKYNNVQSDLLEMEKENKSLSKRKEEIDALLSQEEARGANIRELSKLSTDEANMYLQDLGVRRSLLQFILKYREDKVRLAETEEKLSEDVLRLKQEISAARASLQELASTKSSLQQETESCKQRLIFIEKRAPELEAEKKVAATARNFKEAARIAAEAKALSIEREELQAKIEGMLLDVRKLDEEISSTFDIVHETEGQMSSKEKDMAMARFQRLTLIAGAAAAERSTALELGDHEEAEILLIEAESASAEAKRLESIHDIKEEEIASLPKYFVSMELISKFGGKRLEELAASAHILES